MIVVFHELIERKIGQYLINRVRTVSQLEWLIKQQADLVIIKYGEVIRQHDAIIERLENPEVVDYVLDPTDIYMICPEGLRIWDDLNGMMYIDGPLYSINQVKFDNGVGYFILRTRNIINSQLGREQICLIYQNLLSSKIIKKKTIPVIRNNQLTIPHRVYNINNDWVHTRTYWSSKCKMTIISLIRNVYRNKFNYLGAAIGGWLIGKAILKIKNGL